MTQRRYSQPKSVTPCSIADMCADWPYKTTICSLLTTHINPENGRQLLIATSTLTRLQTPASFQQDATMAPKSKSSKDKSNVAPGGARSTENLKPLTPLQPELDDGSEGDDESLNPPTNPRSRRPSSNKTRSQGNSLVSNVVPSHSSVSGKQTVETASNTVESSRRNGGSSNRDVRAVQPRRARRQQDGFSHMDNPVSLAKQYDDTSLAESDYDYEQVNRQTHPLPAGFRPFRPQRKPPPSPPEFSFSSDDSVWRGAREACPSEKSELSK